MYEFTRLIKINSFFISNRNELFRSLFGNHITMLTSNDKQNQNGHGKSESGVDFINIFKGF